MSLVDQSSAFVMSFDEGGKVVLANSTVESLLGMKTDDLIGQDIALLFKKALSSVDEKKFRKALEEQETSIRAMVTGLSGEKRLYAFQLSAADRPNGAGRIVHCLGLDIGAANQADEAMRASEDRFRKLVDLVPYGITRTDLNGYTLLANPAYERMMGYKPGESIGSRVWDLLVEDEMPPQEDFYSSLLRDTPSPMPNITKCRTQNGEMISVLFHWMYEKDSEGGVIGFLSVVTDVTRQLESETKLREAKDSAERASREKSSFLAAAGHDLQQPLHSLSILLGVMQERQTSKKGLQIVEAMRGALDGAMVLLRSVLEMSKLEAGIINPRMEEFGLATSFSQIQVELGPQIRDDQVELRVMDTKARVRSDRLLLKSILHNLVANAIRYTPKGKILVGCRYSGKRVRIEVWDTGIGIPEHQQKIIFEEFQRLDNDREGAETVYALGLGLSIVDRTCQLLGTKIRLRSIPGQGSVFSFEIPIAETQNEALPYPSSRQRTADPDYNVLSGKTILVVEDNAQTLAHTKMLLESWGCNCLAAESYTEALRETAGHVPPPDLILADYNLDWNATGVQAAEKLQKVVGADIPVIIITASTEEIVKQETSERNFSLIQKPASPSRLRALLSYHLLDRD